MMFTNEELLDFFEKEGFTDKKGHGIYVKQINDDDYLNLEIEDTLNPAKKKAIFTYFFQRKNPNPNFNFDEIRNAVEIVNRLYPNIKLLCYNNISWEDVTCIYTTMVLDLDDLKAEIQNAYTLLMMSVKEYLFFRDFQSHPYCYKNMEDDEEYDDEDEEDYNDKNIIFAENNSETTPF